MRRERRSVPERQHFVGEAPNGEHRGRRDGDNAGDRDGGGGANRNRSSEGVAAEDVAFWNDGVPRNQVAEESFCAGFGARRRKCAGRSAVPRKIGNEDAEVQVGELLRAEGHHLFVGGQAVEEDHGAQGRAGAGFVDVGGHLAAAGSGEHGVDVIGFAVCEIVAGRAEEQASRRFKERAAVHEGRVKDRSRSGCIGRRAPDPSGATRTGRQIAA